MSEDTTKPAELTDETAETDVQPIIIEFEGYNKPLTLVPTKPRKKKGSEDYFSNFIPKLEGDEIWDFLKQVVPAEKLYLAVFNELIKPAAGEATQKLLSTDPNTGEPAYDQDAYAAEFIDQFNPSSRRSSGPSKKDLEDRVRQLGQELLECTVALEKNPADSDARNRLHHVVVEMSEVNGKLEAKRRGPQKGRKSKKEKAAEA